MYAEYIGKSLIPSQALSPIPILRIQIKRLSAKWQKTHSLISIFIIQARNERAK